MQSDPTVFVVDDDQAVRRAVQRLLETVNLRVETFGSGREFLEAYDSARPGCLVLDLRMPGMSGLELQEQLGAQASPLPVIIITAHGEVSTAVRSLKGGAVDFLQKPFDDQEFLDCINRAIEQDAVDRRKRVERAGMASRLALLSLREREVMDLLVTGKTNRQIAAHLGVSSQAIDARRHGVFTKMGTESTAELMRLAVDLETL